MAAKYINIFQSKALQNLPKWGFLVRKQTIWQPWAGITRQNFAAVHDSKYEPSFLFKKKTFFAAKYSNSLSTCAFGFRYIGRKC
jgi:transposase